MVPTRWLELILGLALSYSAFTTIRQLGDELPKDLSADGLAIRFGLERWPRAALGHRHEHGEVDQADQQIG